jgi:Zn-dependent metalloprotease
MLEHVARNAPDQASRDAAMETLTQTSRLMGMRDVLATIRPMEAGPGVKQRTAYDCRGSSFLPGVMVRREGYPTHNDRSVNEAFDGAGATYDLFMDAFGHNSLDGQGMRLVSSVHYSRRYNNAFWNGRQMVYGDGDGRIFNRFTSSLDICGHELTHGLTQFTAGLYYSGQSGALNEHFSDVFGSIVKQRRLGHDAASADWIIGDGIFKPGVQGVGIRSMKAPGTAYDDPVLGKDPQPDHMSGYVVTDADNGGVHVNSGIPNKAFHLFATAVGGNTWEGPGKVWFLALTTLLRSQADFVTAARATVSAAQEVYGSGSAGVAACNDAWQAVGVF